MAQRGITILGLDPGIDRLGWAITKDCDQSFSLEQFGLITTDKKADSALRLAEIYTDLQTLLQTWKPTAVYIESLFFSVNAKTAMTVSEVRGVIKAAIAAHNLPVLEIHPMQLKKKMVGTGKANKKQITEAVISLFSLEKKPATDDVADAIAIAYVGILERFGQI